MKNRLFLVTLVIILFSFNGIGQNEKFSVGIEAGPNMGVLYGNEAINGNSQLGLGFSAGAAFQYNFPKLFSIRTKLAFESKVATQDVTFYGQNGSIFFEGKSISEFNYITLPIMARITLGNRLKFFGDFGGFIGVLINNKQKYRGEGYQFPDTDNTSNMSRIDGGITVGVGGGYQINEKLLLHLNVRNNLGLANMSKLPVVGNGMIATNVTNFLVGLDYCFGSGE